ncbi:FAD-dependent monooxygenase [Kitasatospora sp. NPDC088346]|uniref:FAD-dependent monooxygenase n=1 Tax=Kitasatospora sp. NPDC088346 TaxID=3364073 RepID=UPI0038029704
MVTDTDVAVIGAGPTGLMLATELARAGVRVELIDRRTERHPHSRALTLHPRSLELLDQRGWVDRFLAHGRTLPGWHFAGLDTPLDFTALDTSHPHTLFLAQSRTEAVLEERARDLGVPVRRGHTFLGLRQHADDGVEVDVRGPEGGARTVRARYVVGCDGGRSPVREAAGIGFPGRAETLTGMLGDFATVAPDAVDRAKAGGVLAVPLEAGLTRIVLLDPERMRVPGTEPVTEDELRAALVRACGSDLGIAEPRWLSRFGNATRLADRYRAGRVLLAGDAAHIHFPAAGQGLNAGLQDAVNLGWKLAAEIAGWAPPGLLDSYHDERHPVGLALTADTEVQTLLWELTLVPRYQRPAAALRELLDGLLGIAEVNRRLAGAVSAVDTRYPPADSPADSPADALVGRRIPDVPLTAPGSPATRVHELLRAGRFVLLGLGADPRPARGPGPRPDLAEEVRRQGWADRVDTLTPVSYGGHPLLDGVTEVLVRPDGHVGWATRTADPLRRRAERTRALTAWAGTPSAGGARSARTAAATG